MEEEKDEIEESQNADDKKALNNFLMAYKIQEFEKQVEVKSLKESSYFEEEQAADLYLNKDDKKLLDTIRCLIRGHSKKKLRWDLVIMSMAVYNCFVIPYQVAFEPAFMDAIYMTLINSLVDI